MVIADRLILLVALAVPIGIATVAVPQLADFQPPGGAAGASLQTGGILRQRPAQLEAAPPPTLAPPTPAPTVAPTSVPATPTPAAQAAAGRTYTVQRGDELRHIAAQHGVSMSAILANNTITDPDNLRVGQVLAIPGGGQQGGSGAPVDVAAARAYTVQPGDELKYIAASNGVSMAAILAANHISDPDNLRVGQVLSIPDGPP